MECSCGVGGQWNTKMSQKKGWSFLFMEYLSLEGMDSWCCQDIAGV